MSFYNRAYLFIVHTTQVHLHFHTIKQQVNKYLKVNLRKMNLSRVSTVMAILCTFSFCRNSAQITTVTAESSTDSTMTTIIANSEDPRETSSDDSTVSQTDSKTTPTDAVSSSGGSINRDDSSKSQTATISYNQWKEENEKRLEEKYEGIKREDQDRAINDLIENIQSALAIPDLPAAKQAELNYAYKVLMKATVNNDASVKKAAYNEALDALVGVLSA